MPPTVNVVVSGSKPIGSTYVDGGSTAPVLRISGWRGEYIHHSFWQSSDPTSCLDHFLEARGEDPMDYIRVPVLFHHGDIDLNGRPGLNPDFSKRGNLKVVVWYKRWGFVESFFEFDDTADSPRLQRYLDSIGVSIFDVEIIVRTVPEFRAV